MKKMWCKPKMRIEEFHTNEYLSTCWGVACTTIKANKWEKKYNKDQYENFGVKHRDNHCGQMNNQVLKDLNDDHVFDEMIEVGTDGLGKLVCSLYTNDSYKIPRNNFNGINIGSNLFWTTSAKDGRTWHHQGKVVGTDSSHPNRS